MSLPGNRPNLQTLRLNPQPELRGHVDPRSEAQIQVDQALAHVVAGLVQAEKPYAVHGERVSSETRIRVRNYKKLIRAVARGNLSGADHIQKALQVSFERATGGFWSRLGEAFTQSTVLKVGDFMQGERLEQVVSSLKNTFRLAAEQVVKVAPRELGLQPLEIGAELQRCVDDGRKGPQDPAAWRNEARTWLQQAACNEQSRVLKAMAAKIDEELMQDRTPAESASQLQAWIDLQVFSKTLRQQGIAQELLELQDSLAVAGEQLSAEAQLRLESVEKFVRALASKLRTADLQTPLQDLRSAFQGVGRVLKDQQLTPSHALRVIQAVDELLKIDSYKDALLTPGDIEGRQAGQGPLSAVQIATSGNALRELKQTLSNAGLAASGSALMHRIDQALAVVDAQVNWRHARDLDRSLNEASVLLSQIPVRLRLELEEISGNQPQKQVLANFNELLERVGHGLLDVEMARVLGKKLSELQKLLEPVKNEIGKKAQKICETRIIRLEKSILEVISALAEQRQQMRAEQCPSHDTALLDYSKLLATVQSAEQHCLRRAALAQRYSGDTDLRALCSAARGTNPQARAIAATYLSQFCRIWSERVEEMTSLSFLAATRKKLAQAAIGVLSEDGKVRSRSLGYILWIGSGRQANHVQRITAGALRALQSYTTDPKLLEDLEAQKRASSWDRVHDFLKEGPVPSGDPLSLNAHPDLLTLGLSPWTDLQEQEKAESAGEDRASPASSAHSEPVTQLTNVAARLAQFTTQRSVGKVALSLVTGLLKLVAIRLPRLVAKVGVLIWRRALQPLWNRVLVPFAQIVLAPIWNKALWPALRVVGTGLFWALYGLCFPLFWIGKLMLHGAERAVAATNVIAEGAEKLTDVAKA